MLANMVIHLVWHKDCVSGEVEQQLLQAGFLPGSGELRRTENEYEYDRIKKVSATINAL